MVEMIAKVDTPELAPHFDIPVYIFQGKFDYQISYYNRQNDFIS